MKILKIKFRSIDDLFNDSINGDGVSERHTIFYDTREQFNKSLTQQKVQVLSMIASKRPNSISELVSFIPAIKRERMSKILSELEAEGYIKFESTEHGGKSPMLSFEYDAIFIEDLKNAIFINQISLTALKKIESKQTISA